MSVILSGFLGLAVNIVPSLFKIFAADREEGDVREAAIKIVESITGTNDPTTAESAIKGDQEIELKLQEALAELALKAIDEQKRAEEEVKRIDLLFLELENTKREQIQKQQLDLMNAELKSAEAARNHALELSKSKNPIISGINPFLSLLITGGFLLALYLIMVKKIENSEIFYTAIGTLATAFATIIGFHFGSSSGSKEKDEMIVASTEQIEAVAINEVSVVADDRVLSSQSATLASGQNITPLPDPSGAFGLFRQKTPKIMQDLMNDFGLTLDQAAGILGNIGHECAGFRKLQEIAPTVQGSRGGWGWAQWTGPRRRTFEKWSKDEGIIDLASDEANYGYLKHELETTERNALRHLKKTRSLADATRSFMEKFERPGIKHFDSRLSWAREAQKTSRRRAA